MEAVICVAMALLLPALTSSDRGRSLVVLLAMGLTLSTIFVPAFRSRRWVLAGLPTTASLLLAVALPNGQAYTAPMHLMMHALLVRLAPVLSWPLAFACAALFEVAYMGAKSDWSIAPYLSSAVWPTVIGDTAAKLALVALSKCWHELNLAARNSAMAVTAMTGSSVDLIALVDRNGTIRSVNGACRHLLGFEPDELSGRSYRDAFSVPDAAAEWTAGLLDSGQTAYNVMKQVPRKDGSLVWLEWNLEPFPELDAVLCIGRDVSRRTDLK